MANVNRKCLYCKQNKPKADGLILPVGFFCCHEHAVKYAYDRQKKQFAREKARQEKAKRKADREEKIAARPRSWYLAEAQRWFNRFIRLRDSGKPCISCGKPDKIGHVRNASHYISVGASDFLRYNEDNVHASCYSCNRPKSGNIAEYRPRLAEKIGVDRLEVLETSPRLKKWDVEELKELISKYKAKCQLMEDSLCDNQAI